LGRLGTVLGVAYDNIHNFNSGRRGTGGEAVCLAAVDGKIPPDLVEAIAKITGVKRATPLRF
jgi:D-3-phosphoglycerate dehydrogenase